MTPLDAAIPPIAYAASGLVAVAIVAAIVAAIIVAVRLVKSRHDRDARPPTPPLS